MRFIVAHTGARRGYAVPTILQQYGMLEHFYTDLASNVGWSRWLAKWAQLVGADRASSRLTGRRIPQTIRSKTSAFTGRSLWYYCRRTLFCADSEKGFRQQLRWTTSIGRSMARQSFGQATHFYSMLGECGPMLVEAKRRGLKVVSEIYILLSAERRLEAERRRFVEWEESQADFERIRKEFGDVLLSHTDFAVCPSEAVRYDLEENFGFPLGRSAVVPYGVDPGEPKRCCEPTPGRVLFVGTACLRKGIQYLALASQRLVASPGSYEFRVAGDVTMRIASQPACKRLKFLGRLPREAVQKEYATADVFVLPSLAEGSAEVVYEALAAGIPVITTRASGSVVRDGVEGRIIGECDAQGLAAAIQEVVTNRSMRTQMAERARERARQYTTGLYGERLVETLRSLAQ